jgi:hypothetical protein
VRHLDGVLERLYRAGLSLKLEKCHFCKDTVSYLGHVIRPGKLAVAEKNTLSLRTVQPFHSNLTKIFPRFLQRVPPVRPRIRENRVAAEIVVAKGQESPAGSF